MNQPMLTGPGKVNPPPLPGKAPELPANGPDVRVVNDSIYLGGVLTNQAQADLLLTLINALRPVLKPVGDGAVPDDLDKQA